MGQRFITCQVEQLENKGQYALIKLRSPEPLKQMPGQYTMLRYTDTIVKPYSIASSPNDEGLIEICAIVSEDPTIKKILSQKTQDLTLDISEPAGNFEIPKADKTASFLAGGSGISPLRSMIKWRLPETKKPTTLIFGCQSALGIPYLEDFQSLAREYTQFHFHPIASEDDLIGVKQGNVLDILKSQPEADEYFLCGPKGMIEAANRFLINKGISEDLIFTDKY